MEDEYLDLLIVDADGKLYVVEIESHTANARDLVEFQNECGVTVRGEVVGKTWCQRNNDTYRCMALMHTIHTARKLFHTTWEHT